MQSLPNSHLNWQCGGLHCEKTDFHSLKNRFSLKKRQWSAQSLLTSSQWKRDKAQLLKITPWEYSLLWTQYIQMNFDNSYCIVKKKQLIKFCTVSFKYTTIWDFHELALMLKMNKMCDLYLLRKACYMTVEDSIVHRYGDSECTL